MLRTRSMLVLVLTAGGFACGKSRPVDEVLRTTRAALSEEETGAAGGVGAAGGIGGIGGAGATGDTGGIGGIPSTGGSPSVGGGGSGGLGGCGNGSVAPPEECDDGNTEPHDGCNPDCTTPSCGDGYVDPPEECDTAADPEHLCTAECEYVTCDWQGNVCDGTCAPDRFCTIRWAGGDTGSYGCVCVENKPCGFAGENETRPGYLPVCDGGGCAEDEICGTWSTTETNGIVTKEIVHCGCHVPAP
jgi:cysteine-rich repeat protein